jgi:hypothetical protein
MEEACRVSDCWRSRGCALARAQRLCIRSGQADSPAIDWPYGRVARCVAATRTRRFVVGLYDASGAYPQVKGDGVELAAVNASLRRAG